MLDGQPANRVGNIPAHFYDDMPHIGYDIDGKKVMKPAKGDELDKFLKSVDQSSWFATYASFSLTPILS